MKYAKNNRIHIFGASGSGTTTLGKALSKEINSLHYDTDDFFWIKSDPPYQRIVPKEERQTALRSALSKRKNWVLSGSLCGWGDFAINDFTIVVYLYVPKEVRIERLKRREIERYGLGILDDDHPTHKTHMDFMSWAENYDDGGLDMRSKKKHEEWIMALPLEVLRIEGETDISESVNMVLKKIVEK